MRRGQGSGATHVRNVAEMDTSIGEDDDERKCRRLPPNAVGPIECSTSRGLAAVRIGANRFIVLDLEEDEEDDDENDDDE